MSRARRVSAGRWATARAVGILLACVAVPVAGVPQEFGEPYLLGSVDPEIDRSFGAAVAIDGDKLAVGAPHSPEGGVVYVFERQERADGRWRLTAMLTGGEGTGLFGSAVTLEGDTLVVGAPYERSNGTAAGAAYVFYRDGCGRGCWQLVRRLVPGSSRTDSYYGISVSLSGDRLAVGAIGTGRVYVHERDAGGRNGWGVQAEVRGRITAPVVRDRFGITGEAPGFGAEVELDGRTLVVGAIEAWEKYGALVAQWSYGMFLFELEEGSGLWRQRRHYESPALRRSGEADLWGGDIGLDGSVLLAGEYRLGPATGCHLYERRQGRWGGRGQLWDPEGALGRADAVEVRGNTAAIVGYHRLEGDPDYGYGVLVYERHAPTRYAWGFVARLMNPEVIDSARAIAIGPREIVIGHSYPGVVQVFPRRPMVADDFEAGEITGFSRHTGNLRVLSPGLAGSDHALAVRVDGTSKVSLVRARQPVREPTVSLAFDLAANRVALRGRRVEILNLYGPSRDLVRLTLEADPAFDQYWATLWAWENRGVWRKVGSARMPPLRNVRIGIEWRAATGPEVRDGRARLLSDGRLRAEAGDLDSDRQVVNGLLLGLPKGSQGTSRGEFLLDGIEVHR